MSASSVEGRRSLAVEDGCLVVPGLVKTLCWWSRRREYHRVRRQGFERPAEFFGTPVHLYVNVEGTAVFGLPTS